MRYSKQREAILSILRETDSHPTADWVYAQVRHDLPHISLGTVYRNLTQLEQQGQIRRIVDQGHSRFDANLMPHHHFRCLHCANIYDLHIEHVDFPKTMPDDARFKVTGMKLELLEICNDCQTRKIAGDEYHAT